jgi:hypothetical protein
MPHPNRPRGYRDWLVAALVFWLLMLSPVDASAEIAAGVNGVAHAGEFSATCQRSPNFPQARSSKIPHPRG